MFTGLNLMKRIKRDNVKERIQIYSRDLVESRRIGEMILLARWFQFIEIGIPFSIFQFQFHFLDT